MANEKGIGRYARFKAHRKLDRNRYWPVYPAYVTHIRQFAF
jgi:hypothetical protein